jgi:hypothetical protein
MKKNRLLILAALYFNEFNLNASLKNKSHPPVTGERIIQFSGYDWVVRDGSLSGPGPNTWNRSNVWMDENGDLHLKISRTESGWTCAEVTTIERLGFGIYQFQVIGPIDQLDANVVFGMFTTTEGSVPMP